MTQRTIVTLSISLFVAALVWGGYSLIIYLGMPIHQLVYSTQDDIAMWDLACGSATTTGVYFCKGAAVFVPFLTATFKMLSPFFPYIIISLLVAAGVIVQAGFSTGVFHSVKRWRPIYVVAAFAVSVWLIGTTLSLGSLYNWATPEGAMLTNPDGQKVLQPFNRFYEPTAAVYTGASTQALAELQANFRDLSDRGCLSETGITTQSGARLYNLSFLCSQQSIFVKVGTQFLLVALFLLNLLALGRFLLVTVLKIRGVRPLMMMCLSFGLGALGWVAALWTVGLTGQLHSIGVTIAFFGLPIILYPHTKWWLQQSWDQRFDVEFSWNAWLTILSWALLSYLALNFLNVVRPFPIGWDDLGSYINRPRLLASYGAFIPSMSQFQWEYLTSLGYLIFGYDSWVGSAFAMEINWAAGLLAVLSVYVFGRTLFGRGRGVLAAILYYFLPMVGHFSFADMKIDNASFFTTALAVFAACLYLFPEKQEGEEQVLPDWKLILVSGLLIGFSFAVKPTAVLGAIMIGSIIIGALLGPWGFTGTTIAGFGVLQKFGALNVSEVSKRALLSFDLSQDLFIIVTLGVGIACIAWAIYRRQYQIRPLLQALGLFLAGFAIAVAPWMIRNAATADYLSINTALSARDTTAPQVFFEQKEEVALMKLAPTVPIRYLPPELKLDPKNPSCQGSARTEELDRYWGFNKGFSHYLTLPWRQVMNADGFGYYVTLMPALLLFPLLLLLPFFWMKEGRQLRLLFAGSAIFLVQWALVANGIPWYGIGMFLGFSLALEAFIVYAPDSHNRYLFGFLLFMSIVICLTNRLWQFDSQKNLFEYPLGKITAEALREVTIPDYDDIRERVVSRHTVMTETPYTYRIGTFISYFIPKNREIFPLADHQLTFFSCLNQEQSHALTLKRLRALGFNSIIFDTNTQTIEKDPNGSLHQKVAKFKNFLTDPSLGLDIVVDDPGNGIVYVELPAETATGSTVVPAL